MEKYQVVPDILDAVPKESLEITYPTGVRVDFGNELTPTQVKDRPTVSWKASPDQLFTLLLTDPDAPPGLREARHWLVVNIPGNKIENGQILVDFIGSGPSAGSGLHRYVFLVFQQKERIESNISISDRSVAGRLQTSTRKLIEEFNLGNPIAGNLFRAQYDDYVPILHQKLGGLSPKA